MNKISFMSELKFEDTPQITKMLETTTSKDIRICMKNGNIMREHTAPAPITIMVISGAVDIESNGEIVTFKDGDMVYFEAKVPHSLSAKQDSVVRLILSKSDTLARVQGVLKPTI